MAKILVVEDSRTQAREIQFLLEDAGYEVGLAGNGVEGLAALQRGLPDVVLTDLDMPQMNGLELVEAVRRDYPAVPVILMTALGSEEIAVQALQKGAASYVPKRNLTKDIVNTLENVLAVAQASGDRQRVLGCLTQSEHRFVLDNDPSLVPPLIVHLEENVSRVQAGDRTDQVRVGIALHEALLNAIYHGNLEVSSDLRQDDEQVYQNLAKARRQEAPYRDRRVHVTAALTRSEEVYIIEDQGPGFDPSTLPDPSDPANLERIGGRGLTLIRTFMDEVEHNPTGNRITLRKRSRAGRR
jgi:CheY-like chemotaxis protein/anti-sigma regulatory factor (Ser/Thr protein kinase)